MRRTTASGSEMSAINTSTYSRPRSTDGDSSPTEATLRGASRAAQRLRELGSPPDLAGLSRTVSSRSRSRSTGARRFWNALGHAQLFAPRLAGCRAYEVANGAYGLAGGLARWHAQ